jgi:hypothetical protein
MERSTCHREHSSFLLGGFVVRLMQDRHWLGAGCVLSSFAMFIEMLSKLCELLCFSQNLQKSASA